MFVQNAGGRKRTTMNRSGGVLHGLYVGIGPTKTAPVKIEA